MLPNTLVPLILPDPTEGRVLLQMASQAMIGPEYTRDQRMHLSVDVFRFESSREIRVVLEIKHEIFDEEDRLCASRRRVE